MARNCSIHQNMGGLFFSKNSILNLRNHQWILQIQDDIWLHLITVVVSVKYPLSKKKKRGERERERNQNSQEKTCDGNRQASDFEKHASSKASLRHHRHLVFCPHSDLDPISPQPRFGSPRLGFLVLASAAANLGPRIWFRAASLATTAACDGLERRFSKEIINRNEVINLETPINSEIFWD